MNLQFQNSLEQSKQSQDSSILKDKLNHTINTSGNINETVSFEEEESLDGISEGRECCVESELATLKEVKKVFGILSANDAQDKGNQDENLGDMLKNNDYFILFLDPESRKYYRKIIGRDDYIRLEPLEDHEHENHDNSLLNHSSLNNTIDLDKFGELLLKDQNKYGTFFQLKSQYEDKIKTTLILMAKMLVLPEFSWTFVGEADSYRRRPFPLKFLQYECSNYPVYVFESELSMAFAETKGIEIQVDLSEYKTQIEAHTNQEFAELFYLRSSKNMGDGGEVSLVTSVPEFVKDIRRYIFTKYKGCRIYSAKDNYELSLKVNGFREYIAGNYQLLQFERVRICLRKSQPLKLILTEINTNERTDSIFPTIFKMSKSISFPRIHINQSQKEQQEKQMIEWHERVQNFEKGERERQALQKSRGQSQGQRKQKRDKNTDQNNPELQMPKPYRLTPEEAAKVLDDNKYSKSMDKINFEKMKNSSLIFWYSPVPNLHKKEQELLKKQDENKINYGSTDNPNNLLSTVDRETFIQNNGLSAKDKTEMNWVDVPLEKQQISISRHRFINGGTTMPRSNEQIVVNSGEINWGFKFKITSLERINKIFEEIQNPVATNNLETEPRNVTLNPKKVKKAEQQKMQKMKQDKKMQGGADDESENFDERTNFMQSNTFTQTSSSQANQTQQQKTQLKEVLDGNDFPKLLGQVIKANKFRLISEQSKKSLSESDQQDQESQKKIKEFWQAKNFRKILKKDKKLIKKVDETLDFRFQDYKEENFLKIKSPFCNFADSMDTIKSYENILRFSIGNYTPMKIKIEFTLYHGAEKLVEQVVTEEVYFSNNIVINKWTNFKNLRYCQLPVKTRLSVNIILVFKEGYELTIGCVSMNLFDENKQFKSGTVDLNIWPFYEIDERLGCMKEYKGRYYDIDKEHDRDDVIQNIHKEFCKLILEFETFTYPMYYSSRDINQIKQWKLTENQDDKNDKKQMLQSDISQINKELAELKKVFLKNPLSPLSDEEKLVLFRTREHYQTYPQGLPWFLRSVQWDKPLLVNETYKMLENWAPMEPEEAICLLDAKFPDERVRSYAVERLNNLSDDELALYMLQFSQALLYEEQHYSPLSDMLITRALQNPYVVGQSFFWSLKGNLYLKVSYERYYLLLEQYLMLCGKFRNELQIQLQATDGLCEVQKQVMLDRYGKLDEKEYPWKVDLITFERLRRQKKQESDLAKKEAKDKKQKQKKKKGKGKIDGQPQLSKFDIVKQNAKKNLLGLKQEVFPLPFNMTVDPKFIVNDFAYEKMSVMNSKKVPMRLAATNAQPGGDILTLFFKNGDDLRQDILTLQIIRVMDIMWLSNGLDLKMTPYQVFGTHCMQGYIECNNNCDTLAAIQYEGTLWPFTKKANVFRSFNNRTIWEYMNKKTRARLSKDLEPAFKAQHELQIEYDKKWELYLEAEIKKEIVKMRRIFSKSTAGYCVSSYVLGLGDRHPDNIMINYIEGHFLHIDFGHFLGNVKKKFGITRERDPFVLTPEVAYFINGGPFTRKFYNQYLRERNRGNGAGESSDGGSFKFKLFKNRSQSTRIQGSLSFRSTQNRQHLTSNGNEEISDEYLGSDGDDFEESDALTRQASSVSMATTLEGRNEGRNKDIEPNQLYKTEEFLEFEQDCCDAYNILRKNGSKLINLFLLMLSAGMPELMEDSDIEYLVNKLNLEMTEQEASKLMKKEITRAQNTVSRRVDNWFHNVKAAHL